MRTLIFPLIVFFALGYGILSFGAENPLANTAWTTSCKPAPNAPHYQLVTLRYTDREFEKKQQEFADPLCEQPLSAQQTFLGRYMLVNDVADNGIEIDHNIQFPRVRTEYQAVQIEESDPEGPVLRLTEGTENLHERKLDFRSTPLVFRRTDFIINI